MAEDAIPLKVFSQSALHAAPVFGGRLACNPVIDLAATVGDEGETLYIWRANQQVVAKYAERNQAVGAIRWKEDGQALAVGWSDGVVRLVGLENSKAVHNIHVADGGSADVLYIAWARNWTGQTRTRSRSKRPRGAAHHLLPATTDLDDRSDVLDLPHELTFLEIDTALPKLSPLPVSGGSGDDIFVFSTRASLEFVFRPLHPEDTDSVDVMIVGLGDGSIHLSICNSFVVGSWKNFVRMDKARPGQLGLCGHGSHADLSTHFLLFGQDVGQSSSLYLVPMDLTFVHTSPVDLSLLASKTTTLQNLLRYMQQTQSHMVSEWKSTRELPNRFLASVQEDLDKAGRGGMNIVQALYHTLVTGHVYPAVRDWLVDGVAERGHKRWDKAVVSGLENLRALVHENLLPALERCGILLSRLLGLARFHAAREEVGFGATPVAGLVDMVACLTLVAHRVLGAVMDELARFRVFSHWLRFQIDRLAAPSTVEELTEREATMDHETVLAYLRRYLLASPLALFLGELARDDYSHDWDLVEDGSSRLEMVDEQLKRHELGQPYTKALPNLGFLVSWLAKKATAVFADIAQAQKRNVRFGPAEELSIGGPIRKHVARVCLGHQAAAAAAAAAEAAAHDEKEATVYTAVLGDEAEKTVHVFRTKTGITKGISGTASTTVLCLELPDGIIDLDFLDDESLLLLSYAEAKATNPEGPAHSQADKSRAYVLRVRYRSSEWTWLPFAADALPAASLRLGRSDCGRTLMPIEVPGGSSTSKPAYMTVRPRSQARGEMPARLCLLGEDKTSYTVYALPEDWEAAWRARNG